MAMPVFPFPGLRETKATSPVNLLCAQIVEMLSEAGNIRAPALKNLLVPLWARLVQCINQLYSLLRGRHYLIRYEETRFTFRP